MNSYIFLSFHLEPFGFQAKLLESKTYPNGGRGVKKFEDVPHNNYMDAPKLAEIGQNLFVSALISLFSETC